MDLELHSLQPAMHSINAYKDMGIMGSWLIEYRHRVSLIVFINTHR